MSVNVLNCTVSAWRGDGALCRWCNVNPPRGGERFCSIACVKDYADNHIYVRGKERVFKKAEGPCGCRSLSRWGGYIDEGGNVRKLVSPLPHAICAACGECEEQVFQRGDKLTCNHITPRNGIPLSERDCIHHMDNLEALCWRDHDLLNRLSQRRDLLDKFLAKDA